MPVTADPLLWEELLEHPLAARRGAAPRELIDFIGRHNEATGRPLVACTTRTAPGSGAASLHATISMPPDCRPPCCATSRPACWAYS